MEKEKILIEGRYKYFDYFTKFILFLLVITFITIGLTMFNYNKVQELNNAYNGNDCYYSPDYENSSEEEIIDFEEKSEECYDYKYNQVIYMNLSIVVIIIVSLISTVYFAFKNTKIVVTNKRIYGIPFFFKRVDLPLDSVSLVSTSFFYSIVIATSSGRIKFYWLENRNEVFAEVNKLLIERQDKNSKNEVVNDELKELEKIKSYLEKGIITQEEYDAKRKKILDL